MAREDVMDEVDEDRRGEYDSEKGRLRTYIDANMDDLRSSNFYFSAFAELLATMLFVYVSTRVASTYPRFIPEKSDGGNLLGVAVVFGFAISINVWLFAPISGAHFNPAVTIALASTMDITLVRAVVYVIMQLIGSILGALLNYAMSPNNSLRLDPLGSNMLSEFTTVGEGFGYEIVTTFYFMFTIMASIDPYRGSLAGFNALWIGVAGLLAHLVSVPFTGTGINPARSFGPNLISTTLNGVEGFGRGYWIYWVAPIVGAVLAGWVYNMFFCAHPNKGLLPGSRLKKYDAWKERMAGRKDDGKTLFQTA
mmetsp:Transcript_1414/g.4213  ORF Transcript_1414/g.4213 Transcript_1414/m.4213 type:complete len:309 (-) Transcript_1414:126-1052(-)|eukprot:CAMPEP_0198734120 /NCGR_PEP_ID=MMETSP1475-20131203/50513_1 /TAXON_ID= ORGANISM="Unidentified sp., Strain CCMP1999" /NCGR_SAMPLE_ID=MMETSP1475 /ASSEMBLY_ACC=CAM_ASM_001111 /LENGTH=308 /DNA_ID=CAMNT_0044497531 /DNA_START=58 /DNA_END=984 /DNA_ORIENTATION=+